MDIANSRTKRFRQLSESLERGSDCITFVTSTEELQWAGSLYNSTVLTDDKIRDLAEGRCNAFGGMINSFDAIPVDPDLRTDRPSLHERIRSGTVSAAILLCDISRAAIAFAAWSAEHSDVRKVLTDLGTHKSVEPYLAHSHRTLILEDIVGGKRLAGQRLWKALVPHWRACNVTHVIGYRHEGFHITVSHNGSQYVAAENNSSRRFSNRLGCTLLGTTLADEVYLRHDTVLGLIQLRSVRLWMGMTI